MDYYHQELNYVEEVMSSSSIKKIPPKRLLIFINVLSGKGHAVNVFIQATMPYFQARSVKYDIVAVIPSEDISIDADNLKELLCCEKILTLSGRISAFITSLSAKDMEAYDAFVVIGGDGTLGELVTGCILSSQQDGPDGKPYHINADSYLKPFQKPIGVVPAGSTDAVSCTLHGSRDPHLASIGIALGLTTSLDIQAIFADDHFAKISLAAVSCGFMTETLLTVKRLASFGFIKSVAGTLLALAKFKPTYVAIEYRTRNNCNVSNTTPCDFNCKICQAYNNTNKGQTENGTIKPEWRWAAIEPGAIAAINAYSSPLRIPMALATGIAPLCHMSDGTSQMFVIPYTFGRFNLLCSMLAALKGAIPSIYHQKNSLVRMNTFCSCTEYRVIAKATTEEDEENSLLPSVKWNVDGELISANTIHSVVYNRLITFYGTGGPLPNPSRCSSLYFSRIFKSACPSMVLNQAPLKQHSRLCCPKLIEDVCCCWIKRQLSSASFGRVVFFIGLCGLTLVILLFYSFYSVYIDPTKKMFAFSSQNLAPPSGDH